MSELYTYDPQKVNVIVGTQIIGGFQRGSFVSFEFDEEHFTKTVGVGGKVTRTSNSNYTGKLGIVLEQSSPSNDYLSGLVVLDRASGGGVVPVLVRDQNGTTLISSAAAWVLKTAKAEFSNETTGREWLLDTAQAVVFVGGIS